MWILPVKAQSSSSVLFVEMVEKGKVGEVFDNMWVGSYYYLFWPSKLDTSTCMLVMAMNW